MKISKILSLFAFAFAFLSSTEAFSQTVTFGPYSGSEEIQSWGTNKKENYDVAVLVKDAALVGKTITGVRVPFASNVDTTLVTDGRAFITKKLTIKSSKNVPDVTSQSFKIAPGFVEVTFDTPYTITSDGVYVGYSFNLDSTVAAPLQVISTSEDNFYLHTSRTYRKFMSKGSVLGIASAMQVEISGIPADQAVASGSEVYVQYNTPASYAYTIKNVGSTPVSSIDYSYELAGTTTTGHYDLPEAIPAHFGKTANATIDVPAIAEPGEYTMKFAITKVNGKDNAQASTTSEDMYHVLLLNPKNRPLLEEYTGTWCGFCPRGFVGLEHMNELLGDDFVGVSYHNGDPMEFVSASDYPSDVPGFPAAYINRTHATDAYCGDNYDGHFNIDDTYAEYATKFAPVGLEATAVLSSDEQKIDVSTNTQFAVSQSNGRYQLTYILTADGLSGTSSDWIQHNYYNSRASSYPDDDMKQFTQGASEVSGLVYNFVVVGWSGKDPVSGSLPETVAANASAQSSYTFDLSGSSSLVGSSIIQDKSKLHVVVAVIDTTTGEAVNALKVKVTSPTGIRNVESQMKNINMEYYSIDGKRLAHPMKGLNIVKLSNGKTIKAVVR